MSLPSVPLLPLALPLPLASQACRPLQLAAQLLRPRSAEQRRLQRLQQGKAEARLADVWVQGGQTPNFYRLWGTPADTQHGPPLLHPAGSVPAVLRLQR